MYQNVFQMYQNQADIILNLEEEVEELIEELNEANMDEDEEEEIEFDSGYAEEMAPENL